jgi:N-formylmaleamate deformylase
MAWQAGDLIVDGYRLHYYRTGHGAHPVVFAHGFTDNALCWQRLIQALPGVYDCVAYDGRGHGLSDRAMGAFSEATRVTDLSGLMEGLGLEHPGLVGHSLGAASVALVAANRPDLPRWLVLEDPAWMDLPPGMAPDTPGVVQARKVYMQSWRDWLAGLREAPQAQAFAQIRQSSPEWTEQDVTRYLEARRQVEIALFDLDWLAGTGWREVVAQIRCPFLLLTGEKALGGVVSPELAEEAVRINPAGRWVQIQGAGHHLRFSRFEDTLAAILQFLAEVDPQDS